MKMKFLILIVVLGQVFTYTAPANAQFAPLDKIFANCAALNKVYPGGVAKSANWAKAGGKLKNTPEVNAKIYKENSSKDRDKDGIACEN